MATTRKIRVGPSRKSHAWATRLWGNVPKQRSIGWRPAETDDQIFSTYAIARYADVIMSYALDLPALREARRAKGLTQGQLSNLVGVASAPRVSAWESGQQIPHPGQLRKLADVLEVPITQLLEPVLVEDRDLRRLRIEAGLTIVELAARVHVAEPTLKRWERGEVKGLPRRLPLIEIARALRVDEATVAVAMRRTQIP